MHRFYSTAALIYFVTATSTLMLLAMGLFASAVLEVVWHFGDQDLAISLLDAIGLIIIGFAVIETAKFIAEEEVFRQRELRSPMESRRSLTKFVTIIVIAASLEALVMVFKTTRTSIPEVIYPALLLVASMLALTSLGAYQWLSSRIEPASLQEQKEVEEEIQREEDAR